MLRSLSRISKAIASKALTVVFSSSNGKLHLGWRFRTSNKVRSRKRKIYIGMIWLSKTDDANPGFYETAGQVPGHTISTIIL
jgi:hypothetical protein